MARKFLYIVAVLTVLVIAAFIALRFWAEDLTEIVFVPTTDFVEQKPLAANVYTDPDMWISRPGLGEDDPARWLPPGVQQDAQALGAAVFFIHPTSYFERDTWNPALDDGKSQEMAALLVRGMASPFNASVDLWVPRYRQATFGAFLTSAPAADKALDAAYGDVLKAFDYFIATVDKDRPIILAGHSQGAFHLKRLLRDRVANTPLADRIAAAYAIGWPVSLVHDLPEMGLAPCTAPDQPECVMSWLSVGEPAETDMLLRAYERRKGLDGKDVAGSAFLCVNPLTGAAGGEADTSANLGALVPNVAEMNGELVKGLVPARCRKDGFLSIGEPPELGPYVFPGNNFHLYDIPLFWANLRKDVANRVTAWKAVH